MLSLLAVQSFIEYTLVRRTQGHWKVDKRFSLIPGCSDRSQRYLSFGDGGKADLKQLAIVLTVGFSPFCGDGGL
jgi:hypothetical protein